MKTEEKAKKVQNIATALAAIFGAVGAFFGIFQAQMSANLKNQVTSLQNASQQTIVNVISTLGDDAQAADLAQSGDTIRKRCLKKFYWKCLGSIWIAQGCCSRCR